MVIMVSRQRVNKMACCGRDVTSTLLTHFLILVKKPTTVDEARNKRGENVNLLSGIIWAGNDFMRHDIQHKACDAIPELH
jgi:hypothetical protein